MRHLNSFAGTAVQLKSRRRWSVLLPMAFLGFIGITFALWRASVIERGMAETAGEIAAASERLTPATSSSGESVNDVPRPRNPVNTLQAEAGVENLLVSIERASREPGISVAGVQIDNRVSEAGQLRSTDVVLHVRATYPRAKKLLGDVLARNVGVTLVRLDLRRSISSSEMDVELTLRQWSQPVRNGAVSEPILPAGGRDAS
jgi:hypothetical protein